MVAMDNYNILSKQLNFDVESAMRFFNRSFIEKNEDIPHIIDMAPTRSKRFLCIKTIDNRVYIIDEVSILETEEFEAAIREY